MLFRPAFHLVLHFIVPGVVSQVWYKERWFKVWGLMMLTMIIDLDHLLANPVYDPYRCGIGFHPLHSYIAIGVYLLMAAVSKLRVIAIGLLIHIGLDIIDCAWMRWG